MTGLNPHAAPWHPYPARPPGLSLECGAEGKAISGISRESHGLTSSDAQDFDALAGDIGKMAQTLTFSSLVGPPSSRSGMTMAQARHIFPPLPPPRLGKEARTPWAGHGPPPPAPFLQGACITPPTVPSHPAASFEGLCATFIAEAADRYSPGAPAFVEALRERADFIDSGLVLRPLMLLIYSTWQTYPDCSEHDARARFALAELVAMMVRCKIMPRAQVFSTLVSLESRQDWQPILERVGLASSFMDELRLRLDAWVPMWSNCGGLPQST